MGAGNVFVKLTLIRALLCVELYDYAEVKLRAHFWKKWVSWVGKVGFTNQTRLERNENYANDPFDTYRIGNGLLRGE